MSRAEEQALKAYPRTDDSWGDERQKRVGFIEGYKQAEKDSMEKNAVEGKVETLYRHIVYVKSVGFDSGSICANKQRVFAGDKVKVIIIKE